MNTRRRRAVWIVTGAVILGIALILIGRARSNKATTTYQTATVAKGTLVTTVSGSGNVVTAQSAKINPQVSGTVANLAVKLGDQVKKGQLLLTIVNDQVDVTVGKSYASWLTAKQTLTNAQATATNQAIDSGQAKAQVVVDQAQTTLLTDQQALQKLQDDNNAHSGTHSDTDIQIAQNKVTADQDNLNAAQIALRQSNNSAAANTDAANQQLAAAKQGLTNAWNDYQYQKQLAGQRQVTAPIDGTITTLSVADGDQLGSGGGSSQTATTSSTTSSSSSPPVEIQNLSSYQASVSVNEVDAPKVVAGQKVSLTFDAIDGLTLTGKVDSIDPVGTVNQGVVSYAVTIGLDSLDPRLRLGMSLSSTITTEVKQDVLTVPSTAVKSDSNGTYVQIMKNGTPTRQEVQVGAASDTDTEITSGLNEGDVVVTRTITSSSTTSSATSRTGASSLFGGGSGGSGGGIRTGGGAAPLN